MTTRYADYVIAIKDSAIKTGAESLTKYLIKRFAFLSFGPFAFLVSMLAEKLLTILIKETEHAIYYEYTELVVNAQSVAYKKAVMENYQAQKNGTPQEKKDAEKKLMDAFKSFVKLNSI